LPEQLITVAKPERLAAPGPQPLIHEGLLAVAGRVRVVAGCDSVGVTKLAIATVDANFSTSGVVDDLAGTVGGLSLRWLVKRRVP
jgi:hypothetical protein